MCRGTYRGRYMYHGCVSLLTSSGASSGVSLLAPRRLMKSTATHPISVAEYVPFSRVSCTHERSLRDLPGNKAPWARVCL